MRFDVAGARSAGYSTEEIASFLAQRLGLDLGRAREAGYSDDEIVAQLAERGEPGGAAAAAPAEAASRTAGQEAARGLGVGVRGAMHMVGALPGALYDVASLPVRGAAYVAGLPQPRSSAQIINAVADGLGLPEPESRGERMVNRVATEVGATAVGMGAGRGLQALARVPMPDAATRRIRAVGDALTSHPGTQVAGATGAGLAGGTAAEAGAGPVGDLGASVAGGFAGAAAVPIAAGTARGLGSVASLFTERGAERAAAAGLLRASDDPTTLPERLRRQYRGLEESQPTAGEVAGDSGLLQLERALRNQPEAGPLFNLRDQGRDAARRDAIEGLERGLPGEGTGAEEVARGVGAVGDRVRATAEATRQGAVDAADAALALREGRVAAVDRGRTQRVQGALDGLPEGQVAEVAGPIIREEADDAARQAWERTQRAFAAVDPEGTSRLPLGSVLAMGDEAVARLFRPLGAEVPDQLRRALDDLRAWIDSNPDGTAPWANLQAFRSRLVDLQNSFGSGSRANSRALAVVNEMKREVDAVARRAAEPFERPTMPRTQGDMLREDALEGAAQNPDVDRALMRMHEEDMGWTGGARAGGDSFLGWLRRQGGLNFNDADLSHYRDAARRYPGLASNSGLSLHRAMERAASSGFFPQFQDGNSLDFRQAFLAALDETLRGRGPRLGQVEGSATGVRRSDFTDDVAREVERRGGVFRPEDPDETLRSIRQAVPEEAYGAPAGTEPPGQPGFVVDPRAEGWAFTPEHAARYRAAIDARAEQGRLFERDAMGRVLGRGEFGARSPDSVVAQQFFHGGDSGASDVRQLIEALGERGRAAQALEAYAAQSLRDFAFGPDGRPVASRVRSWLQRHAAALRQLPEVQAKFADVETAARTAEASARRGEGLARRGAEARDRAVRAADKQRDAEVARFERGAARYWLKDTEPEVAIRRALSAGNAEMNIRELRVMMRGDAPALRGLRRAYAEEWLRRVSNVAAMHADGAERLRPVEARRFLQQTERAAKVLFSGDELRRIQQIAQDFRSGSMVTSVGRAVGSNTAQNIASLRSMSTAYVLGRVTQGLIRGDAGGLPMWPMRPLQYLLRMQEGQVAAAMADLMLDPAKAARLTEQVSAKNLEMVRRYAERNAVARFGQAAFETGVRAGSRAAGSAQAGEAQREARRGFAAGGVVEEEPRVFVRREMPRADGRSPHPDGSALARYSLPAEGDLGEAEHRMPAASFRVPYTPAQREEVADQVSVVPAGVSGRRPRALGGPDMRQEQRPMELPRMLPSSAAEAGRSLALGVRGAAHAASGLPALAYDLAALPVGAAAGALGLEGPRSASDHLDDALDVVGLPRPASRSERALQTVGREVGTGVAGLGLAARLARSARPVVRGLGEMLRDSPRMILGGAGAIAGIDEATSEGFAEGGMPGGRVGLLMRGLQSGIRAYHGSPHVFDRFDLSHIGRGEGAQAYGRGHYFTESEGIAEDYRNNLLRRRGGDQSAPYRIEWDDPEAGELLARLSPEVRQRMLYPAGDLQEATDWLEMADPAELPGWYRQSGEGLSRQTYHRPEVMDLARNFFADPEIPASHYLDDVRGELDGVRAGGGSRYTPDQLEGQIDALDRLPGLAHRVVPNLGATYEARLRMDPDQLLSLDHALGWQSGEVRRRLLDGRWGPRSEEFLGEGWDRLSDPQTRISGLEDAWRRDRTAGWRGHLDTSGLSAQQQALVSDLERSMGADGPWGDFLAGYIGSGRRRGNVPGRASVEEAEDLLARATRAEAAAAGDASPHVSDELARVGIPGSRYRTGQTRSRGAAEHNMVVFGDDPIEVVRRYRRGGLAGA